MWSVEKLVSEFVKRGCNFEIVFFESESCDFGTNITSHRIPPDNQFLTLYGGDETSSFAVSSRRLARTILKGHLQRLDIPVTTFIVPIGKEWKDFVNSKKVTA